MSILVSFEGPDAVGKETQAKMLCNYYNLNNIRAVYYEFPLNDSGVMLSSVTFKSIKKMLTSGFANKYPNLFQAVQFMNKFFFNALTLPKLMNAYDVIILDRWSASVLVYGYASNVNKKLALKMFTSLRHADMTVILNGSSFNKDNKDSYEKDNELQTRVKKYYTEYQNDYNSIRNILNLSPNQDIQKIHKTIIDYIDIKTTR